jgi:hypothetical protein
MLVLSLEKETASPELAVAERSKSGSPYVFAGRD